MADHTKLWSKGAGLRVNEQVMAFTAGEDVILDRHLLLYDIRASRAHVEGLVRIDVLSQEEGQLLLGGLESLAVEYETGTFILDDRYEDCHSAIEIYLTDTLGDVGKKVHTGRSRNDQVLVAMRLYLKDALQQARAHCAQIAQVFLAHARTHATIVMPGYTHLQRAVPSSVGMWSAAFAEAFIDNTTLCDQTLAWVDANPLGTAAGYGVNVDLDRAYTTEALGFGRMQVNPIYAQNARGKFELQAMMALSQAMLDVRRLSWDLSLFTTQEFDFVELPDAYTTGSSIMPNKRNPDVVELLRSSYAVLPGAMAEVQQMLSLPSGYHRDLQHSKGPVIRALTRALEALALVAPLVEALAWKTERMRQAIDPAMHATDYAVELALEGVPFREAYQRAAQGFDHLNQRTPEESIMARLSPGGSANLMLDVLQGRLDDLMG